MIQLASHNEQLRVAFNVDMGTLTNKPGKGAAVCLDSIDAIIRQCQPIDEMRNAGSFFTGQQLATLLVSNFTAAISFDSVVMDPTCGAGNLLIECSRQLGVEKTLSETLKKWGKCLRGFDIHPSFVEAAKLRIISEALSRGVEKDCTLNQGLKLLPHIKVADVMSVSSNDFKGVTHVALNPPFSNWASPRRGFWKKGKVNAAGIVFEHVIKQLPDNCHISAILPEVLRAGSRYNDWREFVAKNFTGDCRIYGRFSSKVDVDVFLLYGSSNESRRNIVYWNDGRSFEITISDYFDVCVGSLVAYRDLEEGPRYPFIHPRVCPSWGTLKQFPESRQYSGKVFKPPLVVIRRTSTPTDKFRAVGTIIQGKEYVAIENHLIVVKPKDNTVESCRRLMKNLKSSITNEFLNERIRCRHLTVGIVKQLPLIQGFNIPSSATEHESTN